MEVLGAEPVEELEKYAALPMVEFVLLVDSSQHFEVLVFVRPASSKVGTLEEVLCFDQIPNRFYNYPLFFEVLIDSHDMLVVVNVLVLLGPCLPAKHLVYLCKFAEEFQLYPISGLMLQFLLMDDIARNLLASSPQVVHLLVNPNLPVRVALVPVEVVLQFVLESVVDGVYRVGVFLVKGFHIVVDGNGGQQKQKVKPETI